MPEKIRFLLDEHIPAAVAAGLKRKGITASTVHELGRKVFHRAIDPSLGFTLCSGGYRGHAKPRRVFVNAG